MAGFGENLRREREMRGISLEEISDTTKISVRLLEALEEDNFSKLPGGIFIRSFIRSYANYLGLDEEQVMAEYQIVAPPKDDEDFSRLGVTGSIPNKSRAPILPWVVAVILLAGGYAIFRYSHRSTEEPLSFGNPPPASKPAPANARAMLNASPASPPQVLAPSQQGYQAQAANSAPAGATPSSSSNPSSAMTAQNFGTADNKSTAASIPASGGVKSDFAANTIQSSASPPGQPNSVAPATAGSQNGLVLQVVATERTWISVKADGKTVLERALNPNDVRTLAAKDAFDVITGNAEGTVLTLNGVMLKPLGRRGEVKMLHLTRDSLKNDPTP